MKRGSFKKKTYTEIIAQQKKASVRALERQKVKKKNPKEKKKRKKKTPVQIAKSASDNLLTPIIKKMYPTCFLRKAVLCDGVTQVAHHHILKSKCTALRYEINNLIPLCNRCHALLHSHESYYSSIIVKRKGLAWFKKLEAKKETQVKADRFFYEGHYKRLKKMHDSLPEL